jgi:outer membrane protein assembly factor BamA
LGYEKNLRGYDYFVIDGQDYLTGSLEFKMNLLPKKIIYLKFINTPKFNKPYLLIFTHIFFDAGYVHDDYPSEINDYVNRFLYSTGIGIDFISYYDKVVRLEYTITGFGPPDNYRGYREGFFIHFSAPF